MSLMTCPNEASHWHGIPEVDPLWRTCYFIVDDMVILLKHWSWGLISFSQAVCFTIMKQGTSSVMTLALVLEESFYRNIDLLLIFLSLRSPFTCITVYSNVLLWTNILQQGAMAHSWVHCQRSYSWNGRISRLIIVTYLLLENDMYMVIDVKTGFVWFSFLLASCLLYNHEERNIFCHDFGAWCLSFC